MNPEHKKYGDCYLYTKYPKYNEMLFRAILEGTIVDKDSDEVKGLIYDMKRSAVSQTAVKVIESDKTVFLRPAKSLPNQFKVFYAKDPRTKKKKLFIDASAPMTRYNLSYYTACIIDGFWEVYYNEKPRLNPMIDGVSGCACFAPLFTHIVDYIGKITSNEGARDRCVFFSAMYFYTSIAQIVDDNTVNVCAKLAGLSTTKANVYMLHADADSFNSLNNFVGFVKKEFGIDKLTTNLVVEKWMWLYGSSTVFAIEYLPAFVSMINDAYTGGYINNQTTVEKNCGKKFVVYGKHLSEM